MDLISDASQKRCIHKQRFCEASLIVEIQLTAAAHGHILTNIGVWSPDGRRLVYDVRSDPAGNTFDSSRIETVDVATREIHVLYDSPNDAKVGVATFHPTENKVVFIHGP